MAVRLLTMGSVAVVVLDTLRYDDFWNLFDWLPGRRFTRAFAPSHWTIPVHASLYTGQYPSEVGVHSQAPNLDYPKPVLPEKLQSAGYRTRAYIANSQLDKYYDGWDRGFDEFVGYASLEAYDEESFDWGNCFAAQSASGYRRYLSALWRCFSADCATIKSLREGYDLFTRSEADGGAQSVLQRLRGTNYGEDEFLFINLMETHTPYHPPAAQDNPVTIVAADAFRADQREIAKARRAYSQSATYLSNVYREIFDELLSTFDYVITLSDHGELFGEHGMVNHSFGIYPELTLVPLVVSGPSVSGITNDVVSLLDVHQTVAELLDVDADSRGQHLLDTIEPVDRLVEYHGPLPFHKAQFSRKNVPSNEYKKRIPRLSGFVSADGSYAYETHTQGLKTIGKFDDDPQARLSSLRDNLNQRSVRRNDGDVPDDVREQLEQLGYA